MHRQPFPKNDTKSEFGKFIHADISGPMQENSLRGARYSLMMKDDYSHWRSLYFIKNKSETSRYLEDFFKKHLEKRIIIFRSNNGLEFVNKEIEEHVDMALCIRERYHLLWNRMVLPNGKIEP